MAEAWQSDPVAHSGNWQDDPVLQQATGNPANAPGTPDLGPDGAAAAYIAQFGEQGRVRPLSSQDMARTGQVASEPSSVTAGTEPTLAANAAGAVSDAVFSLPSFAAQLPKYAYEGLKVASGNESPAEAAMRAWAEAQPQGQAMAQGLQSTPGSREFDAAALQAAMMAVPGLELLKGAHPEIATETPIEKPPVQPEAAMPGIPPEVAAKLWENDPVVAPGEGLKSETAAADLSKLPDLPTNEAGAIEPSKPSVTIPPEDVKYAGTSPEFQARNAQAGQSDAAPVEPASVGSSDAGRTSAPERPGSGTSNRAFAETYGDESVPGGAGVDTTQLLDNARADIRSGAADPYGILSRTRAKGIANAEEYAALAAEHERLVNDAVAKQKANTPDAPQAAKAAEDFANAIQPHKTAASDLMRLFQGDVNYDMSTPFGMDQYMKSELGRTPTMAERPKFNRMSNDIGRAQTEVQQAVARSDTRVQSRYAEVRNIPMEEAASRVREWLKDCIV